MDTANVVHETTWNDKLLDRVQEAALPVKGPPLDADQGGRGEYIVHIACTCTGHGDEGLVVQQGPDMMHVTTDPVMPVLGLAYAHVRALIDVVSAQITMREMLKTETTHTMWTLCRGLLE